MMELALRLRSIIPVANTAGYSIDELVASAEGLGECWD